MTKFYVEIAKDEELNQSHYARIVTIESETPESAYDKAWKMLAEDETIEQITTDVNGCSLPQPVYDWFNGFELYK